MNQCACEDQPEFSRALSVYRKVKAEEKHSPEERTNLPKCGSVNILEEKII